VFKSKVEKSKLAKARIRGRIRKKISGSAACPRLAVFRSLKHIHAQVVDDTQHHTLVAASTLDAEVRGQLGDKDKSAQAEVVGQVLAERALEAGVERVVFDRGGYKYHGRVKSLADAARKAGLEF